MQNNKKTRCCAIIEDDLEQPSPPSSSSPSSSAHAKKYASPTAVCMALHRNLLVAPLLGIGCQLGRHCVQVMEIPKMPREVAVLAEEDATTTTTATMQHQQPLYTWKPLNSIYVTLLKHTDDATAIYVHPSDMHYSAAPLGCLGKGCPTGTALLAQVVLDLVGGGEGGGDEKNEVWNLSVLIFDAIQIGEEDFVQMQLPPMERYRRLMQLCCDPRKSDVLTSPLMRVQWAGEYSALRGFCMGKAGEKNLQHITDSIVQYTREHPCKVVGIES